MEESILVPVNQCDPVDQIVPLVVSIAKPGMRVVFLVRSLAGNWERINAQVTAIQTGNVIALNTCGARERANLELERQFAEARLATVSESLRGRGLETEVTLYTGGLSKALADLARSGNIRFVLMPSSNVSILVRIFRLFVQLFDPHRLWPFSRIVVVHPGSGVATIYRGLV